ncbi:MAG: cache domain-containing protein, partial [Deltaproteobacteria bacterium]
MKPQEQKERKRSIRSSLVLLLLFVLLPMLAVQAYMYYESYQQQRTSALQDNLEIARALSKAFDSFVQDVIHQELAIGVAITSSQPMTSEDITRLLKTSRDYDAVRDFTWMNTQGDAIYSGNPSVVGRNYSDRSYFREIINGREWAVSELLISKATGHPVFGISRGIRDDKGALLGVVVAMILPDKLAYRLGVERSQRGALSLVDRKGMLVFRHPNINPTWEERNWLKQYPEYEEVFKGQEIAKTIYAPFEGKDRLVGIVPISSLGWAAGAGKREEDVTGPIYNSLAQSALLFLSISLVAFFIAAAFARRITAPVAALHSHALSLGRGEEPERLRIGDMSEFQDLAETFNVMADKVKDREAVLRKERDFSTAILDTTRAVVVVLDREGKIRRFNRACEEITG